MAKRNIRPQGTFPIIEFDVVECPVKTLPGSCHVFSRYKCKKGYGWTCFRGVKYSVHRYVWELANGPIPSELEIDHQCRVTGCCNLLHLRAVPHRINMIENSISMAAVHLQRNTCIAGHEWTPENTRIRARVGGRDCRACARRRTREMKARRRELVR